MECQEKNYYNISNIKIDEWFYISKSRFILTCRLLIIVEYFHGIQYYSAVLASTKTLNASEPIPFYRDAIEYKIIGIIGTLSIFSAISAVPLIINTIGFYSYLIRLSTYTIKIQFK